MFGLRDSLDSVATLRVGRNDQPPVIDINGEPIDPIWAAEFRGFFWGEGTLAVQRVSNKNNKTRDKWYSFSIQATIGLRFDDAPLLCEFQRRLGGRIRVEQPRKEGLNPIVRWAIGKAKDCHRVGQLLSNGILPANKAKQLNLWIEALNLKLASGASSASRYTQEAKYAIVEAERILKEMRQVCK